MKDLQQNTALQVSKLFLSWANAEGDLISNLKMQKLLYYAQGWYSGLQDGYLFDDEIEAWAFGPVIRGVYVEYKDFNHSPISIDVPENYESNFKEPVLNFLKDFYTEYIGLSAHHLVNSSHNELPWKSTYIEGKKLIIPKETIKQHFTQWAAAA